MSDQVVLALIALPSSMLTAAAVFISAWRTGKASKKSHDETTRNLRINSAKLDKNSTHIGEVHILVNSRLEDALLRIKHLEEALGLDPGDPISDLGEPTP